MTVTMKQGQGYKRRDGVKVRQIKGPVGDSPYSRWRGSDGIWRYNSGRTCLPEYESRLDLIAEWEDTPEYEVGRWYHWDGGECPLQDGAQFSVVMRNPENGDHSLWRKRMQTDHFDDTEWRHKSRLHIVAFCVREYPPEPPTSETVSLTICPVGKDPVTLTGTMKFDGNKPDLSTWEESA